MNSGSINQQDLLGSVGAQFQQLHMSGASTPMTNNGSTPLHKSSSLLDNLGIQRANSPFIGSTDETLFARQKVEPLLSQQPQISGSSQPSTSSAFDWARQSQENIAGHAQNHQVVPGYGYASSSRVNDPVGVPPPPGVFAPQLPIIESQWKYIDFQGIIQGPFPSQSMSSWLQAGYFQNTLQIARVATSLEPFGVNDTFAPLGDLMAKVGDFSDPFSKLDFILNQAQGQNTLQTPSHKQLSLESFSLGAADQLVPSATTMAALSSNAPTNLSTQTSNVIKNVNNLDSQDYTHGQVLELRDSDGGFYQEVTSRIPVHKFVESVNKVDSTSISIADGSFKTRQPVDQDAVQRRLEYEERQKKEQQPVEPLQQHEKSNEHQEGGASSSHTELEAGQNQKAEAFRIAKKREEEMKRKRADEAARQLLEEEAREAREKQEMEERRKEEEAERLRKDTNTPSTSSPAVLLAKPAPWANKAAKAFTGQSLADVQQREAAQRARRKQEIEQQAREAAAKLQKKLLDEEVSAPRIDSISNWASKKTLAQNGTKEPVKTIEQIQKEQLEQKKFLAEQKRLWEEVQRNAQLKTNTAPVNEVKEWTTVTKKQPAPAKVNVSKSANQPSSYLNPDKLRSVSSNGTKQIGSSTSIPTLKARASVKTPAFYTGNQSTSLRQDFLKWCKSQMKLMQDVDVNGVLEVLLSLPAGPESKEIIADTIYSNSLSMDGRRFATEFIKRRLECESKLNDALSWSEALNMPKGDIEDWEFQVVGKKKNRKH